LPEKSIHRYTLPAIVFSQFAGTSVWFVGNAILPELQSSLKLSTYAVSNMTTAVLIGFIIGTLVFAFFSFADRFSPVRLFFVSSLFAALSTSGIVWWAHHAASLFGLRCITGFFLAGIYPVGMKVASDWYQKGLGKALGYLVGALVLGTAFPYLLKNRDFHLPWKSVLYYTSAFALLGGIVMLILGDGPYRKKAGAFQWNAIPRIFSSLNWRRSAFGYFGHMWEVYAFWGFVPVILKLYADSNDIALNIPLLSFICIAVGGFSSIAGGYLSAKIGGAKVAGLSLFLSGLCCIASPLLFSAPLIIFLSVMLLWGITVVPDSPQYSTLVAQYAPSELRGTALTIYNAVGFIITSLSLQVIDHVHHSAGFFGGRNTFMLLGAGAVAGLPFTFKLIRSKQAP
jgi:MFS family permease